MASGRDSTFQTYPALGMDWSEIVNSSCTATRMISVDISISLRDYVNHLCHTPESPLCVKQSSRPCPHELTPTPALTNPPRSSSLLHFELSHERCFNCESLPG